MDSFDYSHFSTEWVLEYNTRFYLEKIFSHPKLRVAVGRFLQEQEYLKLAGYYFRYSSAEK